MLANNRALATPTGNLNAHYLNGYRAHAGMAHSQYGETTITDKIINELAL